MDVQCSVEGCLITVSSKATPGSSQKGTKEVLLQLNDPNGEQLAELKVPWPESESPPTNIKFIESDECLRLTNEGTFANIPLRISRLHEVLQSRRTKELPKRFSCFGNPPCPQNNSNLQKLNDALKDFVNDPLSIGKWEHAYKCLSKKGTNADGLLSYDEQMTVINYLTAQSSSFQELGDICEVLRKTKVFGPKCLTPFYELCLNMKQVTLIRSVIESGELLSEHSLANFLDYVAEMGSKDKSREDAERLLVMLLRRKFSPRRLAECAAQKITIQHASALLQRCTELYVLPKYSEIAEQALSLMTVLTDTFGNRLIWENDLHDVVKDALEFAEKMTEIVSSFKQIELKRLQTAREEEDDLNTLYTVKIISLPRRPLNW